MKTHAIQSIRTFFGEAISLWHQPRDKRISTRHAYLTNNASSNLKILSSLDPTSSVLPAFSSEEVYKAVPARNYIKLGYEKSEQLQTQLGDEAIAYGIGGSLLLISSIAWSKLVSCISVHTDHTAAASQCYDKVGTWFFSPGPKLALIAGGALLASAIYVHKQGWLGRWIHDPSRNWRFEKTAKIYEEMAKHLSLQFKQALTAKNQQQFKEINETAEAIKKKFSLIKISLQTDLQLEKKEAEQILEMLDWGTRGYLSSFEMNFSTATEQKPSSLKKETITKVLNVAFWAVLLYGVYRWR